MNCVNGNPISRLQVIYRRKFQAYPGTPASQIIIHIRLLDNVNALQQNALGIAGVNLVYGAAFLSGQPEQLLRSLMDGLTTERLEIDMIEFSGDVFKSVDNRGSSIADVSGRLRTSISIYYTVLRHNSSRIFLKKIISP